MEIGSSGEWRKKEWKEEEEEAGRVGLYYAESRHGTWRDSALPRQARWHACASVAARSRRSMWRDPSGSNATGIDATKRASS